jgi:putative protease
MNGKQAALVTGQPPPRAELVLPELLAPAGDWECARAAVENGADAIYFGLEKFNARIRAQNFTQADLPALMEFLHGRGAKGYLTFNTLVFENEMAEAEQFLRMMIAAGVDAAIVQDVGICRLIRGVSPDFPIHVSTQMTVTSAGGLAFARELGCNLVVLARECSLKEIRRCAEAATLPLEVFVHGALCVAYSGQCLTSEALGGRSANRGECAQACRMAYDLVADGKDVPLGDRKYLLSPQDLAGLELLPELVRAGVASLKIEGRLKSPEYVANITRLYRQALDRLVADGDAPERGEAKYEMEMAFSRGLYTGWFQGVNNQQLVHGRFGKKRGVYLGQVDGLEGQRVRLKLEGPLKRGDGVVFDAGDPEHQEEGGRVYSIEQNGDRVWLGFGQGDINFKRLHAGDKLWKTSDPALERRLRQSFAEGAPKFQRPLDMEVRGRAGDRLKLVARDRLGHVVSLESAMPLARAEKQPLTLERLRSQLGRLGGTPFELGETKNFLEGDVLLPVSELNRLRREAVNAIEALRVRPKAWTLNPLPPGEPPCSGSAHWDHEPGRASLLASQGVASETAPGSAGASPYQSRVHGEGVRCASHPSEASKNSHPAQLIVLVRSLAQLETALESGVRTLYCEFEDPKRYREAVARFRSATQRVPEATVWVAPPRIFKMSEDWILKQVRSSEADGYLVRNYDHLNFFAGQRCIGDYSLNIANRLAADYFKHGFQLERVTASYDLNFAQLEALLGAAPPEWFEITIHQHIPMFHMEHCVFCAFLSEGTDYTNCGRPCDSREVKLRDRVGALHPVKADAGCRNTVFNGLAQTGADYVARMLALGARHFRLEFLTETPAQVAQTISKYRQLIAGEITGPQLWRELKLLNQLGVTRGQIAGGKSAK